MSNEEKIEQVNGEPFVNPEGKEISIKDDCTIIGNCIIIGNWFKDLRLHNNQMEFDVIEEYLGLQEGELHLIEEGLKMLDYITINKLIGIYCEDVETDTFKYIMKNINNSLPMNDNAIILNKLLGKETLKITKEGKYKVININEKEIIKVWKEEDSIVVNVRYGDITLEETIKIDHEHYEYKSLLDNIMVIYRKLFFNNIRPLILNKSNMIQKNKFIDKLFEEL